MEGFRYTCIGCGHVSIPFMDEEQRDNAQEMHHQWHIDKGHGQDELRKARIRNRLPLPRDLEASF